MITIFCFAAVFVLAGTCSHFLLWTSREESLTTTVVIRSNIRSIRIEIMRLLIAESENLATGKKAPKGDALSANSGGGGSAQEFFLVQIFIDQQSSLPLTNSVTILMEDATLRREPLGCCSILNNAENSFAPPRVRDNLSALHNVPTLLATLNVHA